MKKIISIFCFFLFGVILYAQENNVRITGTITDESGETLPAATVSIKGAFRGVVADYDGKYEIEVNSSDTLVFSFIGYKAQEIAVNNQKQLDVVLSSDTETLKEVVITAQAEGQRKAIREQLNSNTIKNVVAADRLQENPDANATEAIGRLPGVSVIRSGGEGVGLTVRGLQPSYTNVTMNGVALSSNNGDRSVDISGISQFALGGAEIYKALTSDLEANAVAGTINLKIKNAQEGLRGNFMLQKGYNDLNNDWGNYRIVAEGSNRFFDNKLGVFVSVMTEQVNRSVQTQSSGFGILSQDIDILINSSNLNMVEAIKNRSSATLSLDYGVSESTNLILYGLYSRASGSSSSQSKSYNFSGGGGTNYGFSDTPHSIRDMISSSLTGTTKLGLWNAEMEYGVAYNASTTDNPNARSWRWQFRQTSQSENLTIENRRTMDSPELIPLFTDNLESIHNLLLTGMSTSTTEAEDKNYTAFVDLKIPIQVSNWKPSFVKFGGRYRQKSRSQNVDAGGQAIINNQFARALMQQDLDWVIADEEGNITAEGLNSGSIPTFLDNQYDFGFTMDMDRLNEMSDWWEETSAFYYNQGESVWRPIFGEAGKVSYTQDIFNSLMHDQEIEENYYAAYVMGELNLSKKLMLLPGVRYEHVSADMKGFEAVKPTLPGPILAPLPGSARSASRKNDLSVLQISGKEI